MDFLRRAWAEIDLDKVKVNWDNIKKLSSERYVMPVVKADAYGHGANVLAKFYEDNGAVGFAVSNINEAIKLRKYGITKSILVLGFTPTEYINQLYAFDITQTVYSLDYARQLSSAAKDSNFIIKTHLKLDTGMSRIGFNCRNKAALDSLYNEITEALRLDALNFEGVFTHFSSADSELDDDVKFSDMQYELFSLITDKLKADGFNFKYIHCCNSAASALRSDSEGNLIRPGIILYGVAPSPNLNMGYTPLPVMSVRSTVSMVKTIDKDEYVSYGRTFKAKKQMRIATVPIGYADGYPRALSNKGKVIVNGKFAPIIGRICMDQLTIDVSDIPDVNIGSVVTVIGSDKELQITFEDISEVSGTIAYEIMCNISIRMPRVYTKNGSIVDTVYLGGTL